MKQRYIDRLSSTPSDTWRKEFLQGEIQRWLRRGYGFRQHKKYVQRLENLIRYDFLTLWGENIKYRMFDGHLYSPGEYLTRMIEEMALEIGQEAV